MHNAQAAALQFGQRVIYKGDMANASGRGAIVVLRDCAPHRLLFAGVDLNQCSYEVDIVLEDGREIRRFSVLGIGGEFDNKSQRVMLAEGVAGQDEIAALLAGAAAKKAADKAIKEAADKAFADAKAAALEEGKKLGLIPVAEFAASGKRGSAAAWNLRQHLKSAGIKASVRQDGYSAIYVRGFSEDQRADVKAIGRRYEAGNFNGMNDSYEYRRNAWGDVFGDVRYVF